MLAEMGKPDIITTPAIDLCIRPADTLCPLKAGDELFIDLPDGKLDENLKFTFGVAIHEPGIAESQPIPDTLVHLVNRVEDLVNQLGALL
jgi:hypothetical protein